MKKITPLILFLSLFSFLNAQDGNLESNFKSAFDEENSLTANLGLTNIDGQNFFGFRIQPEFSFGKVGLGLDIPLLFNLETRELRSEEFEQGIGLVRMIRFLRYGVKNEDAIYIKAGDLTGERLGYGALIGNYSNAISFERRKVGLSASILIKKTFGFELLYSDLNFEGQTKMFGVRPFVKPFGQTSLPIIKTMEVGASFVSDNDDFEEENTTEPTTIYSREGITAYGFDMGFNIIKMALLDLSIDAQYVILSKNEQLALDNPTASYDTGSGFSVGVESNFKFIANTVLMNVRLERQWYGDNYIPQFFNFAYEINKDARLQELLTAESSKGIYGRLSAEILQTVKIGGSLVLPDNLDESKRGAIVGVDLETKQVGKFKARGSYVKAQLLDLSDAFSLDERSLANLIVTYKIGRFFEAGVDYQWTFAKDRNGNFNPVNQVRPYFGASFNF